MQQAEKLATIGELASGIAHEIKNPLAGVSAAIQVLSEEFNLKSTRREIIDEIMHQMERLNKMTKDLLSFARPMDPRTLMCDVNDIVDKASFFIRKQAEKQNVGITKELERDIPHLLIDPEQIQQVFLNIMLNALQAMPEGGFLTIATRLSEKSGNGKPEAVEISFSDTGKGIPGENLRKIFNPFYTTKHQGTGLGLSISRNVVEKHKGRFEVDSQSGKGTRFTIVLPVKEEGNG